MSLLHFWFLDFAAEVALEKEADGVDDDFDFHAHDVDHAAFTETVPWPLISIDDLELVPALVLESRVFLLFLSKL